MQYKPKWAFTFFYPFRPEDDPAGSLRNMDDLAGAEAAARGALERHVRAEGPDRPGALPFLDSLGQTLYRDGRYGEAVQALSDSLLLSDKVLGSVHPDTLQRASNLGLAVAGSGRREEAIDLFRNVLDVCVKALGPGHKMTLIVRGHLAVNLAEIDELDLARAIFERVLDGAERGIGSDNFRAELARHNLYEFHMLAISRGMRSVAAWPRSPWPDPEGRPSPGPEWPRGLSAGGPSLCRGQDRFVAVSGAGWAFVFENVALPGEDCGAEMRERGDLAGAEAAARAGLGRLSSGGSEWLGAEALPLLDSLGHTLMRACRWHEAAAVLGGSLVLSERIMGFTHEDSTVRSGNYAIALAHAGFSEEAMSRLDEVVEWRGNVLGEAHPLTLSARGNFAIALVANWCLDVALDIFREVSAGLERLMPPEPERLAAAAANLERALKLSGKKVSRRRPDA
ncbi:MAG: tetratricopeptide repeat protein [Deltaproteobacteria bacterium]|jgi:tetratricopeptide (TPR) repeat protein|nr:tetratricopeptide repeat protein [Deltaproteobacteria bacterium]